MEQASDQAAGGAGGDAARSAAQAKRDLDEAQQQLAERRRKAETDLAHEQLARMQESLVSLRDRGQHEVVADLDRFVGIATSRMASSAPGQMSSVLDTARVEEALAEETRGLAHKLASVEAFALGLDSVAREMSSAAGVLEQQQARATAARASTYQAAFRRLEAIRSRRLKPDKPTTQQAGGDERRRAGTKQRRGSGGREARRRG